MQTQSMVSNRLGQAIPHRLADILGESSPVRAPEQRLQIGIRPCDGCGDPDPSVDLWAENSETGEQLWFCTACGE